MPDINADANSRNLAPKEISYQGLVIKGWHAPSVEVQKFVLARVLHIGLYGYNRNDPETRPEWYGITWLGFGESVDADEPGAVAVARTNDSGGSDYLYFWSYTAGGETWLVERWAGDITHLDDGYMPASYVLSEEGHDNDLVLESEIADYVPFSPHGRNFASS